jgi:hypothetical protein
MMAAIALFLMAHVWQLTAAAIGQDQGAGQ